VGSAFTDPNRFSRDGLKDYQCFPNAAHMKQLHALAFFAQGVIQGYSGI
jgi:hypothetical protein